MRLLEWSSKLEKCSAVGCCRGTSAVQLRHNDGGVQHVLPCCGVPPSTEGKGEEVPQTFFRRESSSRWRSKRDTRSDRSAWPCCTRSISSWKRQTSSRGWKARLCGSIPVGLSSLDGETQQRDPSSPRVLPFQQARADATAAGSHNALSLVV
jgi:hypothetical protein